MADMVDTLPPRIRELWTNCEPIHSIPHLTNQHLIKNITKLKISQSSRIQRQTYPHLMGIYGYMVAGLLVAPDAA